MRHPLERIPDGRLRYAMVPVLVVAVATVGSLPFIMPLRDVGTGTVVELVEAGSAARVGELMVGWSETDRVKAAYAIGMDYLMTLAYMSVFALLLVWSARRTKHPLTRSIAIGLVWCCSILPLTNVAENIMLRDALLGTVADPWPILASFHHYLSGVVLMASVIVILLAAGFPGDRTEPSQA